MDQQVGCIVDDFPMLQLVRQGWLGLSSKHKAIVETDLAEWLFGIQIPLISPVQNSRGHEIIFLKFQNSFVVFLCTDDENLIIVSLGCHPSAAACSMI
jgi:hypothetical protein